MLKPLTQTKLGSQTRKPLKEQTMLFTQVEYGCFADPPAMTNPPQAPLVDAATGFWDCPAGKVGELVASHVIARPHEDLAKGFLGEANAAKK